MEKGNGVSSFGKIIGTEMVVGSIWQKFGCIVSGSFENVAYER